MHKGVLDFVGVHCDEKGLHRVYPCCHHLSVLFFRDDPREKEFLTVVVGSSLVSTVFRHVRSTQKEQFNDTKW